MISEKIHRQDAEVQRKHKESQEKVKAFAHDILLQCQIKGFTVKEVAALIEAVNNGFEWVKYIHENTTPFRYEE